MDFWDSYWAGPKYCPMSKKILQKWTGFVFGNTLIQQTFTECVHIYNIHILIFDMLDVKLQVESTLIYCVFWAFS